MPAKLPRSGLSTYVPHKKSLWLRGPLNSYTGYGLHVSYTARWLFSLGYSVKLSALSLDDTCFDDVRDLVTEETGSPCLLIAPAATSVQRAEHFFTMHETTQVPRAMFDNIRQAKAVFVPSTWSKQCLDAQGLDVPLFVVPIGINTDLFRPAKRKPSICVFGSAGNLSLSNPQRKNADAVLAAFAEAFPSEKDVRLKLKVSKQCQVPAVVDSRVEIVREQWSELALANWFQSLTAYVSPSRCEAFGQMNLQAMACAVPVICCAFGGVTDYHGEENGYCVDFTLVSAKDGYYSTGLWAEPDIDSMVEQMRRVYEDQTEAEMKGVGAYQAAKVYDWNTAVLKLEGAFKLSGFWTTDIPAPVQPPPPTTLPPPPAPLPPVTSEPMPTSVLTPMPLGQIKAKSLWSTEAVEKPKKLPLWFARRTGGHEPVFYMSGDLGDIVYALPTIREFGGGQFCIGPARDHSYYWLREPMTPIRYAVLAPLLELQKEYLTRVFWSDDMAGWRCHLDLNDSRRLHREPYYRPNRNLADVASCFFGLGPGLWKTAWLKVDHPNRVSRFVFARSQRYHNAQFPWKQIVQKHGKNAVFIGVKAEHDEFVAECGYVPFHPTKDLLEAARIMAGADWLVANQSSPMSVAEGLKVNILREQFEECPNCIYERDGNTTNPAFVLDLC